MMNKAILIFFAVFFILITNIFAEIYYVDNSSGNDSNSGLSEAQPWKTISKVNSTAFAAGDQILFKRGSIWFETLLVTSDGAPGNPVVYAAYGEGNQPVIDGSNLRESGIYIHTKNFVKVLNFTIINHTGSGGIRIMYGDNIEAVGNQIFITGHAGVFIENSTNVLVSENTMTTPTGSFPIQTDGIYSQKNSNNIYERNHIVLTNSDPSEHIDGIQSFMDADLIIRGNLIIQDNNKDNAQGIYATSGSGTHIYYNNVVYCPNVTASVVGFRNLAVGTGTLRLYHNTLIGKGGNILKVTEDPELEAKNNIFIALSSNYSLISVENPITPGNIDFNLYYNGGNPNVVSYQQTVRNLGEWQAMGFDQNSVKADPELTDNYTLSEGSKAINRGTDLGEFFKYDRINVQRPQGDGFDLGAYESDFSIGVMSKSGIPEDFQLSQNYPNPFNPSTQIRFFIPEDSEINLKVFDILGNEVAVLLNDRVAAGEHTVEFNAGLLSSGVYIYRLTAGNLIETRKMTLIK